MEKHKRLIDLLYLRTNEGSLAWRPAIEQDAFQVSFADKSVILTATPRRRGEVVDYQVSLTDSEGDVVDTFDDASLDQGDIETLWWNKMRDLYNIATRTARGADKILNAIIADLESDIPF